MQKVILHLCADIGSDSHYYQLDPAYKVLLIGKKKGVENYTPPDNVHGVIANPVCTEFSFAKYANNLGQGDHTKGMELVTHCLRIVKECNPKWWVLENPATGRLKDFLGKPVASYQPYEFGSGYTKKTALWGDFNMPDKLYINWESAPKNSALYIRPNRKKPSLAFLHKSALQYLPEYSWCTAKVLTDADLRSLCCDGFAKSFKEANP